MLRQVAMDPQQLEDYAERTKLQGLMTEIVSCILREQPADPETFLIDLLKERQVMDILDE